LDRQKNEVQHPWTRSDLICDQDQAHGPFFWNFLVAQLDLNSVKEMINGTLLDRKPKLPLALARSSFPCVPRTEEMGEQAKRVEVMLFLRAGLEKK
jgi:hypothetical protein